MRKITSVHTLFVSISLFGLAVLGFLCRPAFAQDATPAAAPAQEAPAVALPSDPTAFMLFASQSNGLSQIGDQSWHLKVSFKIFDEQNIAKDQGIYEEFYVSPKKFKENYSSSGFSRTEYGTDHGRMLLGNPTSPYPLIWQIRGAFVNPSLPTAMQISRSDIAAEQREINGAKYACFTLKPKAAPSGEQNSLNANHAVRIFNPQMNATYCFDPGTEVLRISFLNQGATVIRSSHSIVFQGHSLPGDLEVVKDDKLVLSAHLESIEPVRTSDEPVFIPPPEATPMQTKMVPQRRDPGDGKVSISAGVSQGLLLSKVAPDYPPIAQAARVSGTVVLQAIISKEGRIENLNVISGPPLLQQAALDAVKQWVYKPYLLNGEPVKVMTTVNVIFTLGDNQQ
jgi:TonB family protein